MDTENGLQFCSLSTQHYIQAGIGQGKWNVGLRIGSSDFSDLNVILRSRKEFRRLCWKLSVDLALARLRCRMCETENLFHLF